MAEFQPIQDYERDKEEEGFSAEKWLNDMLLTKGVKFTGRVNRILLNRYFNEPGFESFKQLFNVGMNALFKLKETPESDIIDIVNDFISEFEIIQEEKEDKNLYKSIVIKYTSTLIDQLPLQKLIKPHPTLTPIDPNSTTLTYAWIILHVVFDIMSIIHLASKHSTDQYDFLNMILLYRRILEDDLKNPRKDLIDNIMKIITTNFTKETIESDYLKIIANIKKLPANSFVKGTLPSTTRNTNSIVSFNENQAPIILKNVATEMTLTSIQTSFQHKDKVKSTVKSNDQYTREIAIPYIFLDKKETITLTSQTLTLRSFITNSTDYASINRQKIATICILYFIYTNKKKLDEFEYDKLLKLKTYLELIIKYAIHNKMPLLQALPRSMER